MITESPEAAGTSGDDLTALAEAVGVLGAGRAPYHLAEVIPLFPALVGEEDEKQ